MGTASVWTVVDRVGVQVIIAAVIGGRRTIIGAAVGSIFLIVASGVLAAARADQDVRGPAFALLVILFLPDGLMGLLGSGRRR